MEGDCGDDTPEGRWRGGKRAVAGPEGPRKLAVVTCGGELQFEDGVGNYADNVYLYADLMV